MWLIETLRLMVDVIFICLMLLVLWSFAFGHNLQYITSANRQIRFVFNTNNRREFVVIFDCDPVMDDKVSQKETQERVDQKLRIFASLIMEYEDKIRNFKADLIEGFADYDSKMQLDNLIQSVGAHKTTFWNAHEVAKSCGFEIYASIHDYTQASTTHLERSSKIVRMRGSED